MSKSLDPAKVVLVELTHTYITVDAKNSPLAIGYLASYLNKHLQPNISVELFKYPKELNESLVKGCPNLIAFSNYMWNEELSYAFARRVKEVSPTTVVVFGGPNYPVESAEQIEYLSGHREIDFYIEGEGEIAFRSLLDALLRCNFDLDKCRNDLGNIAGVHYQSSGRFVTNGPAPRISDIEEHIPSPYLTGVMDKFFDKHLTPLLQTSRGCPYSCTFCHDGSKYASKTYRYNNERIRAELEYAARRSQVPSLTLADLNWGIFPQDVEVAKAIKEIQDQHGWPLNIQTATAKNQKERIVEMSRILGNSMIIGASIQSSDEEVLSNIKRKNIGYDAIVKMATESSNTEASTFTEIILCLPGDTKEKHSKSAFDMLDAGIQDINTYQYIMLPGTEGANRFSRRLYKYQSTFRVIPRCFGRYEILGKEVTVAEIHEVVVGNSTMTYDDYLECRKFNLTLMMFNNGQILDELYKSVSHLGITKSQIIKLIHQKATAIDSELFDVYDSYREDEESNFYTSKDDLIKFLHHEGGLNLYVSGERGRNQLHYWKSVAIFERLPQVLNCAISCIEEILEKEDRLTEVVSLYLRELGTYILLKKGKPASVEESFTFPASFDFLSLERSRYRLNPFESGDLGRFQFRLEHSRERRQTISAYFEQYGSDLKGLAHLTHRYPARILHRAIERLN
jgi:radical SAM superfamily enzyme YgiQ (UPF0313 family)